MFTVVVCFAAFWMYYELKICFNKLNVLEDQMNSYKHTVYVATEKLSKGTVVTEDKLHQEIRYSDLPNVEFVTEEAFGQTMVVDVAEGTCLTADMMHTEAKCVREVFISEVEIPDYMQSSDRIDVRIRYAHAEDYVVLADKTMLKCEPGKGMILPITEEEILFLSSSITDFEKYEDAKLYMVRYPECEYAGTGIVNYVANQEILILLGKEKTEGESRRALEKRLMQNQ